MSDSPSAPVTRVEMWALAHPTRFRLFELLSLGPSTASALARRIGESRGTVSYHLRLLARTGAIVEDEGRGDRRERWWRRADSVALVPTDDDVEGRAITARWFSVFFARDAEARRRFMTETVDAEWHRAAFVGNWFVELTPEEAAELGARLFELVQEMRRRREAPPEASTALASISVLPWVE